MVSRSPQLPRLLPLLSGIGLLDTSAPAGAGTVRATHALSVSQSRAAVVLLQGLATHVIDVKPQPLTAELLARAPELAGEVGQQLLQLFQKQGVIDAAGMLVADPRQANWHAVVQESGIPGEQAGVARRLPLCSGPCLSVSQSVVC